MAPVAAAASAAPAASRVLGRAACVLAAAACILGLPTGGTAQTFSGSGGGATPLFVLSSGPTAVTVDASDDAFEAFLMGTDGSVVAELTRAPRQDVEVPEDGRYLFEVRTSGEWRISVEGPDSTRALVIRGRVEGAAAAGDVAPGGWLAKGLGAGLVLGPIGTLLVVQRAGAAGDGPALDQRLAGRSPTYAAAFRESYVDRVRSRRRTAALVGGLTGTALLAFVVLQLTVWDDGGGSTGTPPPPGQNADPVPILSIPVP